MKAFFDGLSGWQLKKVWVAEWKTREGEAVQRTHSRSPHAIPLRTSPLDHQIVVGTGWYPPQGKREAHV